MPRRPVGVLALHPMLRPQIMNAAWHKRRAKRELREGRARRHVHYLRLSDLWDLGYRVRIIGKGGDIYDLDWYVGRTR